MKKIVIDMHTHLAGLGHGGTDCFIAPKKFDSILYKVMRAKLGIYNAHREQRLDQAYLERLQQDMDSAFESQTLDAAVIFAHDRVCDDSGRPHAAAQQQLYVPNEYAFSCAERPESKGRFLPAMSVHPYRGDALDETERWIERGAIAMKWLPNSQGMDPRDRRCKPIFKLLAAKRIPLIAHTGGEHTVSILRPELGEPEVLRPALDCGVTVIMAHCGTRSGVFDGNWMPKFRELALKYGNCWGDTSAFCTPGRARWIKHFLRDGAVLEKMVHGSDYPVPPFAWSAFFSLGLRETLRLSRIWSFLERDVRIKRALGFPDAVFTNAARLFPIERMGRWGVASGPE